MRNPRVGVGIIVIKNNRVLLSKRKGSHGEGTWNFPGGHLEFNESVFDCAEREVMEETGIKIKNFRQGPYTNDIFKKENKHYITVFVIADYKSGEPKVLEPDKCEQWGWFEWKNLPEPLFLPIKNLMKQNFSPIKTR